MAIDISNRPDRPIRKYTISKKPVGGITADVLKLIAIIAMVIDHIAWMFVPFGSFLGQAMHVIGRLTAPIMCFMIAEGYYYTKNVKKYALRLGIFALISHFAYVYYEYKTFNPLHNTSVIYTLFLGLVALMIINSPKYSASAKNVLTFLICLVSMVGDWGGIGVVWIIIFGTYRDRKTALKYFCIAGAIMIILSTVFCAFMGCWYNDLMQFGIFLAVPLLLKYNGIRKGGRGHKWFFYVFYPLHLVLIAVLKYVVLK